MNDGGGSGDLPSMRSVLERLVESWYWLRRSRGCVTPKAANPVIVEGKLSKQNKTIMTCAIRVFHQFLSQHGSSRQPRSNQLQTMGVSSFVMNRMV